MSDLDDFLAQQAYEAAAQGDRKKAFEKANAISDVALRQQVRWKVRLDFFGAQSQPQPQPQDEEDWL